MNTYKMVVLRKKSLILMVLWIARIAFPLGCSTDEFECSDGLCIPSRSRCDGMFDCRHFSDELNCLSTLCPEGLIKCENDNCVSGAQCDGVVHCADLSDEVYCTVMSVAEEISSQSASTYSSLPKETLTKTSFGTSLVETSSAMLTSISLKTRSTISSSQTDTMQDTNGVLYIVIGSVVGGLILIMATVLVILAYKRYFSGLRADTSQSGYQSTDTTVTENHYDALHVGPNSPTYIEITNYSTIEDYVNTVEN